MTWVPLDDVGGGEFAGLLGLRPAAAARYAELADRIWAPGGPDPALLELCRLRIAALHGSPADLAERSAPAVDAGLTEERIAALPDYPASPLFTAHERRALAFAEQYAMDVHGITDEQFAEVAGGMTDAEMTAFTFALGIFDGMTRLRAILGVQPAAVVTQGS